MNLPLKIVDNKDKFKKSLFEAERSVRAGSGKLSKLASSTIGLAKKDPDGLLERIGLGSFHKNSLISRQESILHFITLAISAEIDGDQLLSYVYDYPTESGNSIIIPIREYSTESGKMSISKRTAANVMYAIIYAGASSSERLINWNDDVDSVRAIYSESSPRIVVKLGNES